MSRISLPRNVQEQCSLGRRGTRKDIQLRLGRHSDFVGITSELEKAFLNPDDGCVRTSCHSISLNCLEDDSPDWTVPAVKRFFQVIGQIAPESLCLEGLDQLPTSFLQIFQTARSCKVLAILDRVTFDNNTFHSIDSSMTQMLPSSTSLEHLLLDLTWTHKNADLLTGYTSLLRRLVDVQFQQVTVLLPTSEYDSIVWQTTDNPVQANANCLQEESMKEFMIALGNLSMSRLCTSWMGMEPMQMNYLLGSLVDSLPKCMTQLELRCVCHLATVVKVLHKSDLCNRIQDLTIQVQRCPLEDDIVDLANFLKHCTSLKSFVLEMDVMTDAYDDFYELTPRSETALEDMLEHSCHSLQRLVLHQIALTPKMQFFLEMNERGQRMLLQPFERISQIEWVDTIASSMNDLSCIFHFLHMNPSLCH